jgi:hypothetical protein
MYSQASTKELNTPVERSPVVAARNKVALLHRFCKAESNPLNVRKEYSGSVYGATMIAGHGARM